MACNTQRSRPSASRGPRRAWQAGFAWEALQRLERRGMLMHPNTSAGRPLSARELLDHSSPSCVRRFKNAPGRRCRFDARSVPELGGSRVLCNPCRVKWLLHGRFLHVVGRLAVPRAAVSFCATAYGKTGRGKKLELNRRSDRYMNCGDG